MFRFKLLVVVVFIVAGSGAADAAPDFEIPGEAVNADTVRAKFGQPVSLVNEESVQGTSKDVVKTPSTPSVTVDVKRAAPTAVTSPPTESRYTIQLSSHTSLQEAQTKIKELHEKGIEAFQTQAVVTGVTRYRVCTGNFASYQDARVAVQKMTVLSGIKSAFVQKWSVLREPSAWQPCHGIACNK